MQLCRGWARGAHLCVLLAAAVTLPACTRADADVRTDVETQLAVDPATADAKVVVTVAGGVAKITGEMSSRTQEQRIIAVATEIRGVKQVTTELRLADTAVVAAIKQVLAADPVIGRIPVDIAASDGLVNLRSDQTVKSERERIIELTSKVDGVTRIEDWMR